MTPAQSLSERLRYEARIGNAAAALCSEAADALDAKEAPIITDEMIMSALDAYHDAKLEHWQGFERMRLAIAAALAAIREVKP